MSKTDAKDMAVTPHNAPICQLILNESVQSHTMLTMP